MQTTSSDFFDSQSTVKTLNYTLVPYTTVKEISLNRKYLFEVKYRTSFSETDLVSYIILKEIVLENNQNKCDNYLEK